MKAFLAGTCLAVLVAVGTAFLYDRFAIQAEQYFQGRAANLQLDEVSPPE